MQTSTGASDRGAAAAMYQKVLYDSHTLSGTCAVIAGGTLTLYEKLN